MDKIQILAAEAALRKMVEEGFFSICTIDKINKVSGNIPNKKTYDTLHMLHCVHYKDMPPELLKELPVMIREALGGSTLELSNIFSPSQTFPATVIKETTIESPKKTNSWHRLTFLIK